MNFPVELENLFLEIVGTRGRKFFAPGRVNLLGEHVDYNGGTVLPMALDMGIYAMASPRNDGFVRLYSTHQNGAPYLLPCGDMKSAQGTWTVYPQGVIAALTELTGRRLGADIVYRGQMPTGGGLSSSAAIEVVTALALRELYALPVSDQQLADVAHRAENHYVGVKCGIMDQYASALCQKGMAMELNCSQPSWNHYPLSQDAEIVVIDSTVKRSLADSGYNQRRSECEQALQLAQQRGFEGQFLCDGTEAQFREVLSDAPLLQKRALHCASEARRMAQAKDALVEGRIQRFGELMTQCHWSLANDYQVSHPVLDQIVELATELPNCLGCRLTGAGFGGSAVALIEKGSLPQLANYLSEAAKKGLIPQPKIYLTQPGAGACQIGEMP